MLKKMLLVGMIFSSILAQESSMEMISRNASYPFKLVIPAGEMFIINFFVNRDAQVEGNFNSTDGLVGIVFAHPSSDVVKEDGKVNVKCPGLDKHAVKQLLQSTSGNMVLKANEIGHYGMVWKNTTNQSIPLNLILKLTPENQVVFTGHNASSFKTID